MNKLPIIISYDYVKKQFEARKQYENWIYCKQKDNQIIKIKRDYYALLDNKTGDIYASKFQIASNITSSSFLSYHSALDYYGLSNQMFNELTVSSLEKFNNFNFEGITYNLKLTKNKEMVISKNNVHVTTLEKTIIDCIDRLDLAGGIDELINALDCLNDVNEMDLIKALKIYNKAILYRKTGYILSHYSDSLKLSKNFFAECKKYVNQSKFYFLNKEFNEMVLDNVWNLFVPSDLMKKNNEGLPNEIF